jgi:hypothetical protein
MNHPIKPCPFNRIHIIGDEGRQLGARLGVLLGVILGLLLGLLLVLKAAPSLIMAAIVALPSSKKA